MSAMSEREGPVATVSVPLGASQKYVRCDNCDGDSCDMLTDYAVVDSILDLEDCYGDGCTDALVFNNKDDAMNISGMDGTYTDNHIFEDAASFSKEEDGSEDFCLSSVSNAGPGSMTGSGFDRASPVQQKMVKLTSSVEAHRGGQETAWKQTSDYGNADPGVMPCPVVKQVGDHTIVDMVGTASYVNTWMTHRSSIGPPTSPSPSDCPTSSTSPLPSSSSPASLPSSARCWTELESVIIDGRWYFPTGSVLMDGDHSKPSATNSCIIETNSLMNTSEDFADNI